MSEPRILLKFGRKEHLKSFADGNLYCSNAKTFWNIEEELKLKGQGDKLEAGSMIYAQRAWFYNKDNNELFAEYNTLRSLIHIEPAEYMPVFCMYEVAENDCIRNGNGTIQIKIPADKIQIIKNHFPNADGVVVIHNPDVFLRDIISTINHPIKVDRVHYYNIDKGFECEDGKKANDFGYVRYIMQDSPAEIKNGMTTYSLYAENAYRVLFCKDIFFADEQEYRIVLPDEIINEGTLYPVNLSTKYKVEDIDCLFQEYNVSSAY